MNLATNLAAGVLLAVTATPAAQGARALTVKVEARGRPVRGAMVVLVCPGGHGHGEVVADARTKSDGTAVVAVRDGAPATECRVWAGGIPGRGASWASARAPQTVLSLFPPAVVRLQPVDSRSGRVLDPSRVRITADLNLPRRPERVRIPSGLLTVTHDGPSSEWTIDGLPAMPRAVVTLRIAPPGYAPRLLRAVPLRGGAPVELGRVPFHAVASLCGVVRGRFASRAVVHLEPGTGGPPVRKAPSEDGSFCAEDLAAGVTYHVWASCLYGESRIEAVIPPASHLVLDLPEPRHATGRVVDQDGDPVVRFTVRVAPSECERNPRLAEQFPGLLVSRDVDDPDGTFDVLLPTELEAHLRIAADGFAPKTLIVPEGQSLRGAVVHLARGIPVHGRAVAGDTGGPVPGAMVTAVCSGEVVATARADEAGEFEFGTVPRAQCRFLAEAEGFSRGEDAVDLSDVEPPGDVQIELHRPVSVRGRVVEESTGDPLAGARVEAMPASGGGPAGPTPSPPDSREETTTSDDGSFRIEVDAGRFYSLVISASGYVPETIPLQPVEHAPPLLAALARGATVEGAVLGTKGDGVGLLVTVQQGSRLVRTSTGYGGLFRLEGVPHGAVSFSVLGETERGGLCSGRLFVNPGSASIHQDLDCTRDDASLSGVITWNTGEPAAAVPLFLEPDAPEGMSYQAVTGENGRFSFPGVRPSSYQLRALLGQARSLVLWEGEVRTDHELVLTVPRPE